MEHGFIYYIRYLVEDYVPNEDTNFYESAEEAYRAGLAYMNWCGSKNHEKSIGVDEVTVNDGFITIINNAIIPTEYLFDDEEEF